MHAVTDPGVAMIHKRSAPPPWLVPSSAEVSNHYIIEHIRRCGVRVRDLIDYTCPCETLIHVMCTSCTSTVFVLAEESCEHLDRFTADGVPVRWWAA